MSGPADRLAVLDGVGRRFGGQERQIICDRHCPAASTRSPQGSDARGVGWPCTRLAAARCGYADQITSDVNSKLLWSLEEHLIHQLAKENSATQPPWCSFISIACGHLAAKWPSSLKSHSWRADRTARCDRWHFEVRTARVLSR